MEVFNSMLALLHDDSFARMRVLAKRRPLTWGEFEQLPLPAGFSVQQAWRLLTAIRRQTSSKLIWRSYQRPGDELWYTTTESMDADILEIEAKTRTGGALTMGLASRPDKSIQVRALARELSAASYRDGQAMEPGEVERLVNGSKSPSTSIEKALANTHSLMRRLDEYEGRPIDSSLLYELYGHIVAGTGGKGPDPVSRFGTIAPEGLSHPVEVLEKIVALYGRERPDRAYVHFLVAAFSASSLYWDLHPFPRWNAMLEVVSRALFFRIEGFSLLGDVPLGRALLDWELGLVSPCDVAAPWGEQEPDCEEGFDCTAQFASQFSLSVREVRRFENELVSENSRKEELLRLAGCAKGLNHRQRRLLEAFVADPSLEMTLAKHKAESGCAYATAREDLLGLTNRGLLTKTVRGNAFAFYAAREFSCVLTTLGKHE